MSESRGRWTAPLGDVDAAGSRHQGRRSAVALTEERVVAGRADGSLVAFDRATATEQWETAGREGASVVATIPFDGGVAVGERGPDGGIAVYERDGSRRWRYDTAVDVGEPQKDTRFFLPFVVSLASDGDRLYAASRRYERRGDEPEGQRRHFESVVYAVDPDGSEAWRFETDASAISLDADGERVAVAYNRCTGDHQDGLVVLDAGDGSERWRWDPGTDGQRRVGDVSLLADGLAVTCHGDYRGYRLDGDGSVRWQADLATPETVEGKTVYAYPNHVHATPEGVLFATGNSYPEEGRETDVLHPEEHTAFGYTPDGERRWTAAVEGFASGLGTDGDRVAVPCAQNFRRRDPEQHGCRVVDVGDGPMERTETAGVATAAALDGETVAVVEEPVRYHDDGELRGQYRVHLVGR
jgi:outer membrane protein assembly factor BamB